MNLTAWLIGLGATSLLGLLYSVVQDWRTGRLFFKPLCSLGFVLLALSLGISSSYGWLILLGLICAAIGDVALMYRRDVAFLIGLSAFLLGHVLYTVAFALVGQPAVRAALPVLGISLVLLRWLWPYVRKWRVSVSAYVLVISLMLLFALGVDRWEVRWGALLFYLSDLFVARERFVVSGKINPLMGLPLYYLGQYLLAWSVGRG